MADNGVVFQPAWRPAVGDSVTLCGEQTGRVMSVHVTSSTLVDVEVMGPSGPIRMTCDAADCRPAPKAPVKVWEYMAKNGRRVWCTSGGELYGPSGFMATGRSHVFSDVP